MIMFFFLLVIFGFLSLISSQTTHQYYYININKNWTDAQSYCRKTYTDLATVNNAEEMNRLNRTIPNLSQDVHIGLYRSQTLKWHWSLGDSFNYGEGSVYQNWQNGVQDVNQEACGVMTKSGQWFHDNCDAKRQFACFNANTQTYILIGSTKTWREAQTYCRTYHTDLANARNPSENMDVKTAAKNEVWIGLFKDPWAWSDQSNSGFRFWVTSQPNNMNGEQDCVYVAANQKGAWNDLRCDFSAPFVCHRDVTVQPTTEPAASGPATTQHIQPQNTTKGTNTSTQVTQSLTTASEQDTLILVHENLTWIEAVSYCRKHHVDLVSIHSQELQNRVAGKAVQASTSYVWLGLRYTCSFNFWFWIKNREVGCYQNWADGHGPYGVDECGLSGAMESTGRHSWVGRLENERLNFVCHTCI